MQLFSNSACMHMYVCIMMCMHARLYLFYTIANFSFPIEIWTYPYAAFLEPGTRMHTHTQTHTHIQFWGRHHWRLPHTRDCDCDGHVNLNTYHCFSHAFQTHCLQPLIYAVKLIAFELAGEDRDRREHPVLSRLKIAFFALQTWFNGIFPSPREFCGQLKRNQLYSDYGLGSCRPQQKCTLQAHASCACIINTSDRARDGHVHLSTHLHLLIFTRRYQAHAILPSDTVTCVLSPLTCPVDMCALSPHAGLRHTALMQYLKGLPSLNTCPKWASQVLQRTYARMVRM
jgi:hypothetical protein